MPIRRESSGAAALLDAVLYGDVLAPLSASLEAAHLQPSDLAEAKSNDPPSTKPH